MSIFERIIIKLLNHLPFRSQLLSLFKNVGIVNDSMFPLIPYRGEFDVAIDGGHFKLHSTGKETLENELYWRGVNGIKEKLSLKLWVELAKFSNVIIDIGANTGLYGLAAYSVNSNSKVYSFEPQNIAFDKLDKNVKLNGYDGVSPQKRAISNTDGTATFFDIDADHFYSASLNSAAIPENRTQITYEVKTNRLDNYIREIGVESVDLIKIDAEFHEVEVLEGMQEILHRDMPTLLLEVITDEMADKLNPIFDSTNYLIFNLSDEPRRVSKIEKADAWNLLLCNEDVAKKLNLI